MASLARTECEGAIERRDLVEYGELSVMHFRLLDALNIDEFAGRHSGAYALAHGDPHDAQRVQAPYHYGTAQDLRAELKAQLKPADAALSAHAQRGARWFRVVSAAPETMDAACAALQAKYS